MDKKLLHDAQLKIADARSNIQSLLDNHAEKEGEEEEGAEMTLLEEILETLDEVDRSIEKLSTEQE